MTARRKTSKPKEEIWSLKDVENVWDVLALALRYWKRIAVILIIAGILVSGFSLKTKWFSFSKSPIQVVK